MIAGNEGTPSYGASGILWFLSRYSTLKNKPVLHRIVPVPLSIVLFVASDSDCQAVLVPPYYNIPKLAGSFLLFYNIVPNGGYSMRYQGSADLIAGNNLSLFIGTDFLINETCFLP